ncbi:MAG: hypothetical protein KDJ52_35785, partial [Anaerolineae bacterium]|nr:hypothetical protein [Anaerolineae bacterium]
MKRHPSFITAVLGCLSIYPLLIFILLFTGLSCYLASAYLPRISIFADEAAPIRVKQLRPLPTVASEDLLTSETSGLIAEPNQPRSRFPDQTLLPDDAP